MEFLRSIVVVLIFAIIVGLIGFFVFYWLSPAPPEVRRKWTDPKFRDHISPLDRR